MSDSKFHSADQASLSAIYCEFSDRDQEREFLRSRRATGRRKLRFAAITVLLAIGPLELVDFLNVGWSMDLLILSVTRVFMLVLAVIVLLLTYGRIRFRNITLVMFLLGCAILVQIGINSSTYGGKTEIVVLQMVLISVFALIFYPITLRIIVPVIFGFNSIFFASRWIGSDGDDAELLRMTVWAAVALILGLYTARQLNRAERLNYRELRRRDAAEAQLVAARQEAESANRAKSEFLANMSHELRTPLNAVIGFSEMMSLQIFGPLGNSRYAEYATDIGTSGRHLLSLIDEVLDFSKIEAGAQDLELRPLDLGHVAQEVGRMLTPQATQAQLEIQVHTSVDPVVVPADDRAMRQILLNLISNAIKFTHGGGRVDVHVSRHSNGVPFVSVSDTGVGIPVEEQQRILKPFEQVQESDTRSHTGWGLGLSIVAVLVRLHNATMQISSAPGKGTHITIDFPITTD